MTLGRGRDSDGPIGPLMSLPRPTPARIRTLGEIAYTAYRAALADRGQLAPDWPALDTHHRAALEAAGNAVRAALTHAVPIPSTKEPRRARPD